MSGTMIAAHKAGIPIFVTGGIGGVHRGAESSKWIMFTSLIYCITGFFYRHIFFAHPMIVSK